MGYFKLNFARVTFHFSLEECVLSHYNFKNLNALKLNCFPVAKHGSCIMRGNRLKSPSFFFGRLEVRHNIRANEVVW